MIEMMPLTYTDSYKLDHRNQYPENTERIYSNFTPRGSRIPNINEVVFFGLQYYIKDYLIRQWNDNFFNRPKSSVLEEHEENIRDFVGRDISSKHVSDLHTLGYLPIKICAVPEGTKVPLRVPMYTIHNTLPDFFWLTNFLETSMSNVLWEPCTSATIAAEYRRVFNEYADETVGDRDFVQWQGHDFSYRGMSGLESACLSGAGHLLSFTGTDTVPAVKFLKHYYGATGLIGTSVVATEHSTQTMAILASGKDLLTGELEQFKRLITEVYPDGIVSIVCDSYDYWKVITEILPKLKNEIMNRSGKVTIRPDSGNPTKIICGDKDATFGTPEYYGSVEMMHKIFGGSFTRKGYKSLDQHIGIIYGDSITLERQRDILEGLKRKGFASNIPVLGIGSFTYRYTTRDTFGFAVKTTYGEVDGKSINVFKDPKTDDGVKKSARGLLGVKRTSKLELVEDLSKEEYNASFKTWNVMQPVFLNGKLLKEYTLKEVRSNVAG
jgi:nicotinamide phosphoribosyltransferase